MPLDAARLGFANSVVSPWVVGLIIGMVAIVSVGCTDDPKSDGPGDVATSTRAATPSSTPTDTPVPTATPSPMPTNTPEATPTLAPAPDPFKDAELVVYLWVDEIVVNDRETSAFFGSAKAAFDVPELELQIIVAAGSRSVTFSNCISMWKDEPLTLDCSSGSGIFEQPLSAIASVRANTPEGGMRCERHRTSTIEEAVYACTPTTATPTATATPTDAPTPTPTPIEQLSPADLYQQVSPSIAFIETPSQTGSAVLTSGSYLITNYHVVWPYDYVRVVFPDGTDIEGVPVVGWDPMADLAVLGPVDVSTKPLLLQDAERDTVIGSELFLIGYLAETELIPKPSTTRGVLSRVREWERLGMTYFQTDAAIGSGQSGGALVNSRGHVVGISTFSFGSFALAASSADVMPIVEQIIKGEFTSGLGDRRLPVGQAEGFDIALRNSWDTRAFLLDATAGTMLEVEIEGSGDGWFSVSEAFGSIFGGVVLGVNDTRTGIEYGAVELSSSGVHILLVGQDGMSSEKYADFVLHSNVSLRLLNDPDDGRTVAVGATVAGSLDYPGDRDLYFISLNEGQTVRIYADSVNVDTAIFVDLPDSSDYQGVSDDDSGGGLFGTDAEIVYRAPRSGEYAITLSDAWEKGLGGYYLTVEPERDDTETIVPPAATPAPVSSRLETVRDRGRVICASRNDMPGFGYLDASGNNMGFDIDLCRAVAAAVLGDPSAIDIHLITASERGPTIQSGEVDMLVRTTTQTSSRDAGSVKISV